MATPVETPPPASVAAAVAELRAFNRFYTRVIGVLHEGVAHSPYSLTEARVLFELARRGPTDAAALRTATGLDAGYLSRVVARLHGSGLVARTPAGTDARRQILALTAAGTDAFEQLDASAAREVEALLEPLDENAVRRLVGATSAIRELLGRRSAHFAFVHRPLAPGDGGWIVERHGALYAREYGWDATFEALVARVVGDFLESSERRQAGWIAEADGERAGCVLCVRNDDTIAQLRLLLVEPWARGHGLGGALVDRCIRFARDHGYRTLSLWTNDVLVDARRVYARAGFELVAREPHRSFGHSLVGETWELDLTRSGDARARPAHA